MTPSPKFEFSEEDFIFCQDSLVKVSRTFALNIKVLNGDLHKAVLICYLLCRIIDTIEDCPNKSADWKIPLLNNFPLLLDGLAGSHLESWVSDALSGDARAAEKELLINAARVLRGHASLPKPLKEETKKWVSEMAQGMAKFIKKFDRASEVIINDLPELENYCYYVAGTVGMFLTSSFTHTYQFSKKRQEKMEKNAVSFGVGLQLTNISKDIFEDRVRGWTYFPRTLLEKHGLSFTDFMEMKPENYEKIEAAYVDFLAIGMSHLKNAFDYSLEIPFYCLRARIFCLWPLWMAVQTLITLKENRRDLLLGKAIKIGRSRVKSIMILTTLMSPFRFLLKKDFNRMIKIFEAH